MAAASEAGKSFGKFAANCDLTFSVGQRPVVANKNVPFAFGPARFLVNPNRGHRSFQIFEAACAIASYFDRRCLATGSANPSTYRFISLSLTEFLAFLRSALFYRWWRIVRFIAAASSAE